LPALSTFPAHTLSFFFIPYHSSLGNMALPMLRLSGLVLSTQQHGFSFQPCHLCTTGQAISLVLSVASDLAGISHS